MPTGLRVALFFRGERRLGSSPQGAGGRGGDERGARGARGTGEAARAEPLERGSVCPVVFFWRARGEEVEDRRVFGGFRAQDWFPGTRKAVPFRFRSVGLAPQKAADVAAIVDPPHTNTRKRWKRTPNHTNPNTLANHQNLLSLSCPAPSTHPPPSVACAAARGPSTTELTPPPKPPPTRPL